MDEPLARVEVELGDKGPGGAGEVAAGNCAEKAVAEGAQLQEAFVVCGDGAFDPGQQAAGREIAVAVTVEAVGDDTVFLGGRQATETTFGQHVAGDFCRVGIERGLFVLIAPYTHDGSIAEVPAPVQIGTRTNTGMERQVMKIGVVMPQTEIGPDAATVRAYAEAAEGAGFKHLMVYDHVLGASVANRPDFRGPYTSEQQFHEVFVLFGYLAGITTTLELVTAVVILPQRQTALVAKQAAEIDRLSNGRLRLGVGTGWNDVEYVALNENFRNRGRRMDEQIEVMRALWTNEVVDFTGRYHRIPEAGIKPLPVRQPIPVWIGGYADVVMERIGKTGDGWFPGSQPGEQLDRLKGLVSAAAEAAGRDPKEIGMEGRITLKPGDESGWMAQTEAWRAAGATHMAINTMGSGRTPEQHIEAVLRYGELMKRG